MPILDHLEPQAVFSYFEQLCAIPHGSGNTGLATSRMAEIFGENLRRWTHDEPLLNEIP